MTLKPFNQHHRHKQIEKCARTASSLGVNHECALIMIFAVRENNPYKIHETRHSRRSPASKLSLCRFYSPSEQRVSSTTQPFDLNNPSSSLDHLHWIGSNHCYQIQQTKNIQSSCGASIHKQYFIFLDACSNVNSISCRWTAV